MDKISKTFTLSPELPYFQGHFPGFPVLPAVAFLKLSHSLIEASLSRKLTLIETSSWRYKQPLPPNCEVHFIAIPHELPVSPKSKDLTGSLPSADSPAPQPNNIRSISYKVSWLRSASSEAPCISEGLMRFQFS